MKDPLNPTQVGNLTDIGCCNFLIINETIGYGWAPGSRDGDFVIIDFSDFSNPVVTGATNVPDYISDIVIDGDYAYVASLGNFSIVDISNTSNPRMIGSLPMNEMFNYRSLVKYEDMIIISAPYTKFYTIDVSIVTSPRVITSFGQPELGFADTTTEMEISENIIYVGGQHYLNILEVNSIGSIKFVDTISTDYIRALEVINNYLFAGSGSIKIYDISSNKSDPEEIAYVRYFSNAMAFLQSDPVYIYSIYVDNTLQIFKVDGIDITATHLETESDSAFISINSSLIAITIIILPLVKKKKVI